MVLAKPASLPDLRVLAGIADELGSPLGFRTVAEARAQMEELGPWDGARPSMDAAVVPTGSTNLGQEGLVLSSWKQLIDNGSMQDGDDNLAATARPAVARVSRKVFDTVGPVVTLTGDRGSVTVPAEVADLPDDVVWLPANSLGNGVLADLASPGSRLTLEEAE